MRYYDPCNCRFTQIDSIKDGLNWYGYAAENPLSYVDPLGYSPFDMNMGNGMSVGQYLDKLWLGMFGGALPSKQEAESAVDFPVKLTLLICWKGFEWYKCAECDLRVRKIAGSKEDVYLRDYPPKVAIDNGGDKGTNEKNAWEHCVRACIMQRVCVSDCGGKDKVGEYLNEIYEPFTNQACKMDRHNNSIGIKAASNPGDCTKNCLDKRNQWSVLSGKKPRNVPK